MSARKLEPISKRIGRNIRRLRLMRKLTRAALAKRICLSVEQLRRNEAGEGPISAKRLYWFGVGLNVSLDEFFKNESSRV